MRVPVIAANWKMYKTTGPAVEFVQDLVPRLGGREGVEVVICPPFTCIPAVASALFAEGERGIGVGAQNLHWEKEGAFTGEVSAPMLRDLGCSHVIIGHSERRLYFGETDLTVNRRVLAALANGLTPIFCLGETLEERRAGITLSVCATQLHFGLEEGISAEEAARLIIAYEPVWAIGTGVNATPGDAEEVISFLRGQLMKEYGSEVAERVRILYGGSVKPDNIGPIMAQPNVDGALVGGASLQAESFAAIVDAARKR
ncbi:MAG: triose-phosphate isomerase [Firmicutes bacterium]|nr:triose-phosphate isomerase [Bacillota bacterium]